MSGIAAVHPDQLMWYACGRVDPDEASRIEGHLAVCEECRDEVRRLRSMSLSLRKAYDGGHPVCADLVAYRDDSSSMLPPAAARLTAHLRSCADCGEELARLDRAVAIGRRRWNDGAPSAPVAARPEACGARWGWAAAAMVVVALTLPARPVLSTASFIPNLRGLETSRRLLGLGPWRISVLLPTDAPPATYAMRVRSLDGADRPVFEQSGWVDPATPAVLDVAILPKAGRYVLEMEASRGSALGVYPYPFDVVTSP